MTPPSHTIRVRLRGGLGNQLSCFYAGLFLSSFNPSRLVLDGRFIKFGGNVHRNLEIDKLDFEKQNTNLEFLREIPLPKSRIGMKLTRPLLDPIFKILTHADKAQVINDDDSLHQRKIESDVILDGYFPRFDYFDACKERGLVNEVKILNPSASYLKAANQVKNRVSVHIRMGDYLQHPEIYPILTNQYYEKALQRTCAGSEGYNIFAENFEEATLRYPELFEKANEIYTKDDFSTAESFCLLANSFQIVTANSSFSNWAAKFIDHKGGLVVCPEQMFKHNSTDARPTNWLRIH
jgi:hypothetical protein